ncbi:centromere protein k [Anaeramoeba flamelloides]|uniref:Centromere protein k n=1 Tax=Anaeramoeba flamelloides TaxID=1746091 RepID=A0AAV8A8V2_9EUKA|nr:centromere protein k [Anaeramoeba flamelloides]
MAESTNQTINEVCAISNLTTEIIRHREVCDKLHQDLGLPRFEEKHLSREKSVRMQLLKSRKTIVKELINSEKTKSTPRELYLTELATSPVLSLSKLSNNVERSVNENEQLSDELKQQIKKEQEKVDKLDDLLYEHKKTQESLKVMLQGVIDQQQNLNDEQNTEEEEEEEKNKNKKKKKKKKKNKNKKDGEEKEKSNYEKIESKLKNQIEETKEKNSLIISNMIKFTNKFFEMPTETNEKEKETRKRKRKKQEKKKKKAKKPLSLGKILELLFESATNEPELKWIDSSPFWKPFVELLDRSGVIEKNPKNPSLVRLAFDLN